MGTFFRNKNLFAARQIIDTLQRLYNDGQPLIIERYRRIDHIKESHFLDAIKLYNALSSADNYMLRIERNSVCIYTNDKAWIESLKSSINEFNLTEYWEPTAHTVLDPNTIVLKTPINYEFRVTFGTGKMSTEGFAKWARANPKQIRVGPATLRNLEKNGYVSGMYFYARDERTLQLCNLMLDNIRRIDKIVAKQSLDK